MSVLVLLQLKAKPENADDISKYMKAALPDTRGFDGCNSITVHRDQDDSNNMVIVENWESRQHYETYLAWRTERGDMEKLGAWLSGEPTIRYYQNVGV